MVMVSTDRQLTNTKRNNTPVILIPGWLDIESKMDALSDYLRGKGFTTEIVSPQPSDGSVPIETLATQALAEIDRRIGSGARFDYIGFSMGGIIGRTILHWLGGQRTHPPFCDDLDAPSRRGGGAAYLAAGAAPDADGRPLYRVAQRTSRRLC